MEKYSGKSKCQCGKRAKFRARGASRSYFACDEHKERLVGKHKPDDNEHLTEADYQTWMRL